MRARNYFLPAGQDKGTSSVHMFGGTLGGPIVHNKFFFFFSDETTRQRSFGGNPLLPGLGTSGGYFSVPTAALRAGDFSETGTVIYDPATGNANGTARVPFAFANCPGLAATNDPRFAACNYISGRRLNPIAAAMLSKLVPPTLPGLTNNYFLTTGYDSTSTSTSSSSVVWVPTLIGAESPSRKISSRRAWALPTVRPRRW